MLPATAVVDQANLVAVEAAGTERDVSRLDGSVESGSSSACSREERVRKRVHREHARAGSGSWRRQSCAAPARGSRGRAARARSGVRTLRRLQRRAAAARALPASAQPHFGRRASATMCGGAVKRHAFWGRPQARARSPAARAACVVASAVVCGRVLRACIAPRPAPVDVVTAEAP